MNTKKIFGKAVKDTLPVMAGYLVLGTGFGILLETKGYSFLWALLMSASIYAGSMQFVMIDLITGGASIITTALTTLMVNARHLFYGISMIDKYRDTGKYKPYLIFALTDETYSLVVQDTPEFSDKERSRYCFLVSLIDQCYWVTGSVVGGLLGSLIPFNMDGIDFALTALFVTIFTEQWLTAKDHASALIGVLSSVFCLVIFGADRFLIPDMVLITVLLAGLRWYRSRKEAVHE